MMQTEAWACPEPCDENNSKWQEKNYQIDTVFGVRCMPCTSRTRHSWSNRWHSATLRRGALASQTAGGKYLVELKLVKHKCGKNRAVKGATHIKRHFADLWIADVCRSSADGSGFVWAGWAADEVHQSPDYSRDSRIAGHFALSDSNRIRRGSLGNCYIVSMSHFLVGLIGKHIQVNRGTKETTTVTTTTTTTTMFKTMQRNTV